MSTKNKAVFVDRDGTIARDMPYCSRPEDLQLLPTVCDGLRLLHQEGFKIIVVTNQSGVARGYLTEEKLKQIHAKMQSDLSSRGANIDAVYYCPHHPDDRCSCRKPNTGMLEQAVHDWQIDPCQSFVIGDKYLDMEAANRMGCKAVIVPSGDPEMGLLYGRNGHICSIDFVSADFIGAARWVLAAAASVQDYSIIMPAKNEEHNLQHVLPAISLQAEVILVDGNSSDATVRTARALRPDIRILTQTGRGKGDAIMCGVRASSKKYFLVLDADGSQVPEEIALYLAKARAGYDLVKGSRYIDGAGSQDENWHRSIVIKLAQGLANRLWGTRYTDICYGMFMADRLKYLGLDIASCGFDVEWELMAKAARRGLKVAEVPAIERQRIHGESHISYWRDGRAIALVVFKQFIARFRKKRR